MKVKTVMKVKRQIQYLKKTINVLHLKVAHSYLYACTNVFTYIQLEEEEENKMWKWAVFQKRILKRNL